MVARCPNCKEDVEISKEIREEMKKEEEIKHVEGGYILYKKRPMIECPKCTHFFPWNR